MRIIKVNAIDSTNSFIRKFYEGNSSFEPMCVRAVIQTAGRGQRGSNWVAKAGENLTFSILYPQKDLNISRHFFLSATVALGLIKLLQEIGIPQLKVKWPNDILSAKKKIGGILIENIVKTEGIVASIIGVGLNVNQTDFKGLPSAGSLKTRTGKNHDLETLLVMIVNRLEKELQELPKRKGNEILEEYSSHMFRLDKVSVFLSKEGERFNGIIRGVTPEGKLKLETGNSLIKTYDLKEVQLLY